MKTTDYGFYESEYIDAENAQNIHIFEGHYNKEKNTFKRSESKSCCGKCGVLRGAKWSKVSAEESDEETRKKARKIAKDYEDSKITVCGQCVARLYSDDI